MRRRRPAPDTRPDWRDPDMPVFLDRWYTPAEARKIFQQRVQEFTKLMDKQPQLYWRNDPLYHGHKQKDKP
jgi:hypothetical protein